MSDVKLELNSVEEVAYKLTLQVLKSNINATKKEIFETYEQSLKIVRGYEASEVLAGSR